MKVALISHEFPPYTFGGVATVCRGLAHSLSRKGIDTTIFCGRSKRIIAEKLNDCLKVIRLPCIDMPPRALWFQLQNFRTFSHLLQSYEIIHSLIPDYSLLFLHLKQKLGRPLVTSIHGVPLPELKTFINSPTSFWTSEDVGYSVLEYPLHDFLLKIALANSDHIFTCSYTTFDDLRSLYKTSKLSNISVIHNGICFDEIDNIGSNSDAQDEQEERYIVFAGRLYWIKGIIHLLEAFKIVARNFPDLSLKIFGRGPLEGEIRKMALDAGLEEKILIKGYIPRKKLIEEVKGADLVVLPSLIEANPMFALEAMACRRPVIAFNYPFMREIIVNMHNGILAKPASIADISEKISLVLSDENLRSELGKNAYEYVRKNHDWDILIEKYIKVYTEIIDD